MSITVEDGDSHALVGRNGAGKSTLVSILTGLQAPDRGRVAFDGEPARTSPTATPGVARGLRVPAVHDHPAADASPRTSTSTGTPRARGGLAGSADQPVGAAEAGPRPAETWRGRRRRHTLAGALSVEQRQLVEIARALSFGARLIILDEPTAQLDAPRSAAVQPVCAACRTRRLPLYISHHLEEIYRICDDRHGLP